MTKTGERMALNLREICKTSQVWIDMLDHRNLLSHTYDCAMFEAAVEAIAGRYLTPMLTLRNFLVDESKK